MFWVFRGVVLCLLRARGVRSDQLARGRVCIRTYMHMRVSVCVHTAGASIGESAYGDDCFEEEGATEEESGVVGESRLGEELGADDEAVKDEIEDLDVVEEGQDVCGGGERGHARGEEVIDDSDGYEEEEFEGDDACVESGGGGQEGGADDEYDMNEFEQGDQSDGEDGDRVEEFLRQQDAVAMAKRAGVVDALGAWPVWIDTHTHTHTH